MTRKVSNGVDGSTKRALKENLVSLAFKSHCSKDFGNQMAISHTLWNRDENLSESSIVKSLNLDRGKDR